MWKGNEGGNRSDWGAAEKNNTVGIQITVVSYLSGEIVWLHFFCVVAANQTTLWVRLVGQHLWTLEKNVPIRIETSFTAYNSIPLNTFELNSQENRIEYMKLPGSPVCPGDLSCRRHWAGSCYLDAGHLTLWTGSHWVDRHQATSSCDYWLDTCLVTWSCDHSRACKQEVYFL